MIMLIKTCNNTLTLKNLEKQLLAVAKHRNRDPPSRGGTMSASFPVLTASIGVIISAPMDLKNK